MEKPMTSTCARCGAVSVIAGRTVEIFQSPRRFMTAVEWTCEQFMNMTSSNMRVVCGWKNHFTEIHGTSKVYDGSVQTVVKSSVQSTSPPMVNLPGMTVSIEWMPLAAESIYGDQEQSMKAQLMKQWLTKVEIEKTKALSLETPTLPKRAIDLDGKW